MKNETITIIYRHPKGRFVVIERRGRSVMGGEYCIREAVFPHLKPQPDPDRKRTFSCVSEKERVRFIELFKQYPNTDKVAELCGRSRSAVFTVLKKAGLIPKPKRLTNGDKDTIKSLAQSGMSHNQIGAAIGFSQTVVSRYLREIGMRRIKQ